MKCRRLDLGLLSFVLLIGMVAYAPQAKAQSSHAGKPNLKPRVVTSFIWNSELWQYMESIAVDRHGNIFVAQTNYWNEGNGPIVGNIVKVTPDGKQEVVATVPTAGWLAGLAFDEDGTLYVANVDTTPGVYRIGHDGLPSRVLTLPPDSTPQALAFYRGVMYLSDSGFGLVDSNGNGAVGAIWRKGPHDTGTPTTPWFQDPLISPQVPYGYGANGMAFYRDEMYIGVSDAGPFGDAPDSGRIVRLPIKHDGSPGQPVVLVQKAELAWNDDFAFDVTGTLWVPLSSNGLATVARDGTFTVLANDPPWLDCPTVVAFGTTPATRTMLYLANGGWSKGISNILSFDLGVPGLRLPVE